LDRNVVAAGALRLRVHQGVRRYVSSHSSALLRGLVIFLRCVLSYRGSERFLATRSPRVRPMEPTRGGLTWLEGRAIVANSSYSERPLHIVQNSLTNPLTPGAQTSARCIALLQLFADRDEPMLLRDISDELGVARTAVYRLLAEFSHQGFITKTSDHRYTVGPALIALAARITGSGSPRRDFHDALRALSAETRETVSLHLHANGQRVCIDAVEGDQPIRRVVPVGQTLPLFAGPSGKTILAFLPDVDREVVLERAAADGEDLARIHEQLDEARMKGYLVGVGDRIAGVGGLSVALFGPADAVAALTVSGPAERWGIAEMEAAIPLVRRHCVALRGWRVAPVFAACDEEEVMANA
jgi:DNA-binding IclR family transcriptional regulator